MGTIPFDEKKYKDGNIFSLYVHRFPFFVCVIRPIHKWDITVSYSAVICKAIYLEMV